MTLFVRCLTAGLLLAGLLSTVPAQVPTEDERADRYLDGYMMNNEGERLEKSGDLENALRKFREASEIFDVLAEAYPDWEPNMIGMRRTKVADSIARVTGVLAKPPAQTVAATVPGPVSGPGPVSAAVGTSGVAWVAPATGGAGGGGGPPAVGEWGTQPSGGGGMGEGEEVPSLMTFLQQYEQAFREKLGVLERKNLEMEGALSKWQQWYQWASGEIKTARQDKDALAERAAMLEKSVLQTQRELEAGRATQGQMDAILQQKAALEAQQAQVNQKLLAAEAAAAEASEKLGQASTQLVELNRSRNAVIAERDAALKERDAAMAEKAEIRDELEVMKKSAVGREVEKLMVENDRLKGELETAKKEVVALRERVATRDEEIAGLKGRLGTLQEQLSGLQKENTVYQTQVSELTMRLKQLPQEPGSAESDSPALAVENQLLRNIILRQLRGQARQQQAKALVIAELREMEDASEKLIEQVRELDEAKFTLAPEEERLFTDPQLREMLKEGSSAVQATLIASSDEGTESSSTAAKGSPVSLTVDDLIREGNEALQDKDFDGARKSYAEALRADPKNASALIGLGVAHQRAGNLAESEVALKKCLAYEPDNANAAFTLGITLFKAERLNDAMSAFESCLKADPKEAKAHHYLGIIASRLTLAQRAEKEFRTTLAIDPTFGEAHFNLAVLYIGWSPPQWEKARKEYEDAVAKGVAPDSGLEKLLKAQVSAN